jgi:hypothetical protein
MLQCYKAYTILCYYVYQISNPNRCMHPPTQSMSVTFFEWHVGITMGVCHYLWYPCMYVRNILHYPVGG